VQATRRSFEALVLRREGGREARDPKRVFNASFVGQSAHAQAIPLIMERNSKVSGGQIVVTHKDVGI